MTQEFTPIHPDLLLAKELVYDKCSLAFSNLNAEIESAEYGAFTFRINHFSVKFRVAKTTPTKTGQFVTIWKRIANGSIAPFDYSDELNIIIICAKNNLNFGQFIFPKSVLLEKGIISDHNKEGKRGMRVYPPWDKVANKQAEKTQKWQLDYFLEIPMDKTIDLTRAEKLLLAV